MNLHIHRPRALLRRSVLRCPKCRARRVHCQYIYDWYAADNICLTCGLRWNAEGGRAYGWPADRKRRIATARADLKQSRGGAR